MGWRDAPVVEEAPSKGWRAAPVVDSPAAVATGPGEMEALARGGLQGATLGFGDEIAGGMTAAIQGGVNLLPRALATRLGLSQAPAADAYRFSRDEERTKNKTAEDAHGGHYLGGNIAGALAAAPLMPGAGAKGLKQLMKTGAKLGAAAGLGASDADLTRGEVGRAALDVGVGGVLGGLAGAGGHLLAKALGSGAARLGAKASDKVAQATQKIDEIGQQSAKAETASAKSAAGNAATAAYKNAANIEEALKAGAMTLDDLRPEQLGLYRALLRERAERAARDLATDAARKASAADAFKQAMAAEPERAANVSGYHGKVWNQIHPRLKRYGLPALGTALGTAIGGPAGAAVGALAGAGTRPMMQSLVRGAQHPSTQRLLWRALGGAASAGRAAASGAPAASGSAVRALAPEVEELLPLLAEMQEEEERQRALALGAK